MSEVAPLISDLAVILIVAAVVTVVFRQLRQPVIVGYIFAGIITGPSITFLPTVSDLSNIKIWADIGVIFLVFAMGLDFSFKKLMNVGFTAIIATVAIVCGMMFLGYTAGNAMGFSHMSSIFLGGMLSMSSTAIVFKAFNDMELLQQKFTSIVLGILVVEDLVAVVMMVILSTLAIGKQFEGAEMMVSILKLIAFLIFWSALGIYLIPTLLKRIRKVVSDEILLITSLGLCLGMVMIAVKAGFSAALGAFVMGSLLAETVEAGKIKCVVQPVKDLFAAIFFVSVGMMIELGMIWEYIVPILVLTLLVLIGQVFWGSLGVLLSGQSLKVAVQSGFSLTQVGEFAFIIASLGVSLNVIDKCLYPVIVAVSVITTFLTPYMIRSGSPAYQFIEKHLPLFLRDFLMHYSSGTMSMRHQGIWQKLIRTMFISVILYLIICIFFITLFFVYIYPLIHKYLPGIEGNLLSFMVIFIVISPLLWAIIMRKNNSPEFHKLWADNKFNRGPLVSMVLVKIILCTFIIMSIITRLFNVAYSVGLAFSVFVIGIVYFSKRIQKRFLMMEKQFVSNFQGGDDCNTDMVLEPCVAGSNGLFRDMHLADFVIPPNSLYVGKTLEESKIRSRFQINVIAIARGEFRIDIPKGLECLYPYDKITVVGTDVQLKDFHEALVQPDRRYTDKMSIVPQEDVVIEGTYLERNSIIVNKSIRELRALNCIILGIEREGSSIVNPKPDEICKVNDTIWIAGRKEVIRGLVGE